MHQSSEEPRQRRRASRSGLFLTVAAVTIVALTVLIAGEWEAYQSRTQMQDDPRVARAWMIGTTFGLRHQIQRGSSLQRWLNERNISLLGDYEIVQSQYANDPGSMEIWFNYQSYLIGQPDLECHRVNAAGTAFIDDLGQPYHGFLDIHGKTVGVYLPGFDHSAHEIRCLLHWMPRRPGGPPPVSRPMQFAVKLPRLPRVLPAASSLPRVVTATKSGITVALDAARLGDFKHSERDVGQRDLTFRLKITGGEIANDNVEADFDVPAGSLSNSVRIGSLGLGYFTSSPNAASLRALSSVRQARQRLLAFTNATPNAPMTLTDPYGIPLVVSGQSITPLVSKETLRSASRGEGTVWNVPVNSAGKGTDVVRVHFDVSPSALPGRRAPAALRESVPFDLVVPVQTGDEI